ncbi:hypothetical protein M8J75_005572 [Diaphorina citri]|nr:hypothetical protein M8J75_005572 [Diaphorina citri]
MNFEQFTLPFSQSSSIQTNANTTQTTSSTKFSTTANNASAQVVGVLSSDDGITYLRPVETNGFALNHHHQQQQQQQHQEQQQQSHNQAILSSGISICRSDSDETMDSSSRVNRSAELEFLPDEDDNNHIDISIPHDFASEASGTCRTTRSNQSTRSRTSQLNSLSDTTMVVPLFQIHLEVLDVCAGQEI